MKGVLKQNGENHCNHDQTDNQHVRRFPHYVNTLLEAEGDYILDPETFGPPCLRPREQQIDPKCRPRTVHRPASRQVEHNSSHLTKLR